MLVMMILIIDQEMLVMMIPVIASNLKMKSVIRIVLAVRRLMARVSTRRKL